MYKFKTLDDRQLLLEEIYAELEEILLKKEGNALEEEEERNELNNSQNANIIEEEEEDNDEHSIKKTLRAIQKFDPSKMTDYQKKKFIFNLLNELKEKKDLLQQSLTQINSIIRASGL